MIRTGLPPHKALAVHSNAALQSIKLCHPGTGGFECSGRHRYQRVSLLKQSACERNHQTSKRRHADVVDDDEAVDGCARRGRQPGEVSVGCEMHVSEAEPASVLSPHVVGVVLRDPLL